MAKIKYELYMLQKVNMPVRAKHLYVYLDIKTKSTRTNALPLPNDK
jgi:hypothetical protein